MNTTRRSLLSRFALGAAGLVAGASLQSLPAMAHEGDGVGKGRKQKIRERRRDRRRDRKQRRRRN